MAVADKRRSIHSKSKGERARQRRGREREMERERQKVDSVFPEEKVIEGLLDRSTLVHWILCVHTGFHPNAPATFKCGCGSLRNPE